MLEITGMSACSSQFCVLFGLPVVFPSALHIAFLSCIAMYGLESWLITILTLISFANKRGLVDAAFKDCKPFNVIPEAKYDKDPASLGDYSRRPNGFVYGLAEFTTVGTNLINPCATLQNLTGRAVEVKAQTLLTGSKICVKDDGGNIGCGTGTLSRCWEARSDTVKYEFYCDAAKGCDSDVQFWYRLVPSVGDPDDWCTLMLKNDYPKTLYPIPSKIPMQTTTPSTSSIITLSHTIIVLLGFITFIILH